MACSWHAVDVGVMAIPPHGCRSPPTITRSGTRLVYLNHIYRVIQRCLLLIGDAESVAERQLHHTFGGYLNRQERAPIVRTCWSESFWQRFGKGVASYCAFGVRWGPAIHPAVPEHESARGNSFAGVPRVPDGRATGNSWRTWRRARSPTGRVARQAVTPSVRTAWLSDGWPCATGSGDSPRVGS